MTRIFIVSKYSMFGHGLKSLLRRESGLKIIGQATDPDEAIEKISELQPDVVIIDNDNSTLEYIEKIIYTLPEGADIKVIGLSLQHNQLYLHHAERKIVKKVGDLLKAIEQPLPTSNGSIPDYFNSIDSWPSYH